MARHPSTAVFWVLFTSVLISLVSAAPNNCCVTLSIALKDKVSYANSVAYNASLHSYWSVQEKEVSPYCIVSPANSRDVSTAVKILSTGRPSTVCKFAIRSGGHTAHAGSANIDDGVTIDLSALDEITLSEDQSTVAIGPGQRWRNVYGALQARNLSVSGGRAGGVGVGGLTLGGGLSYFATREGFTCDNVISYEIVLANSSIVNVNSASHHDLWLALKGGSNNFGVVTRFVLRTFKQGSIWAGDVIYPVSTILQQLQAFSSFASAPDFDQNAGLIQSLAFSSAGGPLVVNQLVYAQPIVDPPAFRPFTAIKPQVENTAAITALTPFSIADDAQSPSNLQEITFASTFENDLGMLNTLYDLWNASIPEVAALTGILWTISIQPINSAVISKGAQRGGNSLGLPLSPPGGSLVLVYLSATWKSSADSAVVGAAADKLLNDIIKASTASGTFNRFVDLNHANKDQDPIAGYGASIKVQLQSVSKKYDPFGVFQTAVPGGFKLFP